MEKYFTCINKSSYCCLGERLWFSSRCWRCETAVSEFLMLKEEEEAQRILTFYVLLLLIPFPFHLFPSLPFASSSLPSLPYISTSSTFPFFLPFSSFPLLLFPSHPFSSVPLHSWTLFPLSFSEGRVLLHVFPILFVPRFLRTKFYLLPGIHDCYNAVYLAELGDLKLIASELFHLVGK